MTDSDETPKPSKAELLKKHGAPAPRLVSSDQPELPKLRIRRRGVVLGSTVALLSSLGLFSLSKLRQEPSNERTFSNPFEEIDQLLFEGKEDQVFRKILELYYQKDGNGALWASVSEAKGDNLKRQSHRFEKSPERENVVLKYMESSQDPNRPFIRVDLVFNHNTSKIEVGSATISLKDLGLTDANFSIGRTSANQTYQLLEPLVINCPKTENWYPGNATSKGLQSVRAENKAETLPATDGSRSWKKDFELTSDAFLTVHGFDPTIAPYAI